MKDLDRGWVTATCLCHFASGFRARESCPVPGAPVEFQPFPGWAVKKRGFCFFCGIITLYLGFKLSKAQCLLAESRVGLAETAGKALICLIPPLLSQSVSHPCSSAGRKKTPPAFLFFLLFLWEYLFWRAGGWNPRAWMREIPQFLITSSLAGEGKSNISIKVSSDICGPFFFKGGLGRIYTS